MNLTQAITASPYHTAICERGIRTYTVRMDGTNPESLDECELLVAEFDMPPGVVGRYNSLAHLIGDPENAELVKDNWIPVGEDGEPIAE